MLPPPVSRTFRYFSIPGNFSNKVFRVFNFFFGDPLAQFKTIPGIAWKGKTGCDPGCHELLCHVIYRIGHRRVEMGRVLQLGRAGILPERIIHNDTKFNNVLLDGHDRAQCVIDLDTVMAGYVAYDFGDAIRDGRRPVSTGVDGLHALEVVESVYRSCREGSKVRLDG